MPNFLAKRKVKKKVSFKTSGGTVSFKANVGSKRRKRVIF